MPANLLSVQFAGTLRYLPSGGPAGHKVRLFYCSLFMQQFLYFFLLPHGQGSFRPTLGASLLTVAGFFGSSGLGACFGMD